MESIIVFLKSSTGFPKTPRRIVRWGHEPKSLLKIIRLAVQKSLASRKNIRILHNANSRQTRQKEREGRYMEDATIN